MEQVRHLRIEKFALASLNAFVRLFRAGHNPSARLRIFKTGGTIRMDFGVNPHDFYLNDGRWCIFDDRPIRGISACTAHRIVRHTDASRPTCRHGFLPKDTTNQLEETISG
jgi:hypothetical protein